MPGESQEPEQRVTVLPDATREEMLGAAGMTIGHRWEDTFVRDNDPGIIEENDESTRQSTRGIGHNLATKWGRA